MEAGKGQYSLVELAKELEDQKNNKVDVIADSREMLIVPTETSVKLTFPSPEGFALSKQSVPINQFALEQIADKVGIPSRYIRKMVGEEKYELIAENINTWFDEREKRQLVRLLYGRCRAFLSNRYRVLDNHDLLMASLKTLQEVGAEVQRCDLTDTRMYVKAIQKRKATEIKVGDTVMPGIILRNSEVGNGKFSVRPFMFRLVCSNGMIRSESLGGFGRVHLGSAQELGIYSPETLALESQTIFSQAQDIISGTFDDEVFNTWVEALRKTTEVEIEKPVEAIDNVVEHFKISEIAKENLLNHFIRENDNTMYGLVQAVTRSAQDEESYEKQIKLEKIGGTISDMPITRFERLVAVA